MSKPRTIVFSDIDGTLLDKDRNVSAATRREVAKLSEKGIPFILISSRMPRGMTHLQADLGIPHLPLIAYNGGQVIFNGKTILSKSIPLDIVTFIHELNGQGAFSLGCYHADEWYVDELDYYAEREIISTRTRPVVRSTAETIADWTVRGLGAHKLMCMGDPKVLDGIVAKLESQQPGRLHLYRSKDDYLELADSSISKLTGVASLLAAAYPDVTLGDCVAFGDNYNDVAMLDGVGIGVAVANAREEVKAVASLVVAAYTEDGVAQGLAKLDL